MLARAQKNEGSVVTRLQFGIWVFLSLLITNPRIAESQQACCTFSTRTKPVWASVVSLPDHSAELCAWYYPPPYGAIAYVDSQIIVAALHTAFCPSLSVRHTLDTIIQIDARTGKERTRIEWTDQSLQENRAGAIDVVTTYGGRFLVRVGPFIKLFSSDFTELRSRQLSADDVEISDHWTISVSADGRTGFLKIWKHGSPPRYRSFSTENLKDEPANPARQELSERLVPDNLQFVESSPRAGFQLVSRTGETVYRGSFGDPIDRVAHLVTASAAPRFAFTFGHIKMGLFFWSSPTTVIVFDTGRMKPAFKLAFNQPIQGVAGPYSTLPMLALAPDGTRVAVLTGRVLKVFRVAN